MKVWKIKKGKEMMPKMMAKAGRWTKMRDSWKEKNSLAMTKRSTLMSAE
jgi:hypothetical protein